MPVPAGGAPSQYQVPGDILNPWVASFLSSLLTPVVWKEEAAVFPNTGGAQVQKPWAPEPPTTRNTPRAPQTPPRRGIWCLGAVVCWVFSPCHSVSLSPSLALIGIERTGCLVLSKCVPQSPHLAKSK